MHTLVFTRMLEGYGVGNQGKAVGGSEFLLSQIALQHMYAEALMPVLLCRFPNQPFIRTFMKSGGR